MAVEAAEATETADATEVYETAQIFKAWKITNDVFRIVQVLLNSLFYGLFLMF